MRAYSQVTVPASCAPKTSPRPLHCFQTNVNRGILTVATEKNKAEQHKATLIILLLSIRKFRVGGRKKEMGKQMQRLGRRLPIHLSPHQASQSTTNVRETCTCSLEYPSPCFNSLRSSPQKKCALFAL